MTKKEMITSILSEAEIYHNVHTGYGNMPDVPDDLSTEFDKRLEFQTQLLIDDWIENFESKPINDTGNRHLCKCDNRKIDKGGFNKCFKCDIWHIYSYGRGGATLYWDKYWIDKNLGFRFKYDEQELNDMPNYELLLILKEIKYFNKRIKEGMKDYYAMTKNLLKILEAEKKQEQKVEIAEKELTRLKAYKKNEFENVWYLSRDWHGVDLFEIMLLATNNYDNWNDEEGLKHRIYLAFEATHKDDKKLKRKLESILPLLIDSKANSFLL